MSRKIVQYQHPSEPAEDLRKMASTLSAEEILTEVFRYQEWYRRTFGFSEKDRLTQVRKIYQ